MEEQIKEAIDAIRNVLRRDGGDIEFVELTEDNVVRVRLKGSCAGCPSAQITLKEIVEKVLKGYFPNIKYVESV